MRNVLRIVRLLVAADPWAMARGAALSVVVLVMGAALLGLSGWFITATGLAGLAGIGIAFDVFRPSAGVRFLALGRAAARYGERLLTHDATLRALAALRVVLLRGYARMNAKGLMGLRGEGALTRIVSDVDALDGLVLRLVLPILSALVTHLMVFLVLGWLVGWSVALIILVGYVPAAVLILLILARRTILPSAEAEHAGQRLRRGIIDMTRDREALILAAQLPRQANRLQEIDDQARAAMARLDRAERDAGFFFSILVALVAMGAFATGAYLLDTDSVGPSKAVIGLFVALALAEAVLPLRRGVAELGRMVAAAGRVAPQIATQAQPLDNTHDDDGPLLSLKRAGLELDLSAGEAIVLTGPSGVGKSTLLMQIAGLDQDDGILIKGMRPGLWPEQALRDVLAVLPQRSCLISGSVRDNLSLSGTFDDDALWTALEVAALADDIRARGGLDARLGEAGSGLSGGQARRMALARILLKKPQILLLDEPTEGLDDHTQELVMGRLRNALPDALIVAAMHRGADHPIFDQSIRLVR
ncbi:MAG: ATP-binding cassette domain-containing protein [Roseobacter sp.]|jgi:ATP-binding cassette subfamily C protein CydC|nr:ATP-binding cassette domain-containing protein [Roseobacter sp.]